MDKGKNKVPVERILEVFYTNVCLNLNSRLKHTFEWRFMWTNWKSVNETVVLNGCMKRLYELNSCLKRLYETIVWIKQLYETVVLNSCLKLLYETIVWMKQLFKTIVWNSCLKLLYETPVWKKSLTALIICDNCLRVKRPFGFPSIIVNREASQIYSQLSLNGCLKHRSEKKWFLRLLISKN
jgi:hypothetical protein